MCCLHQGGRTRRSHPEDEGHVMTKGSSGQITPAVAASERRKSLKLVRRKQRNDGWGRKIETCRKWTWSKKQSGLCCFLWTGHKTHKGNKQVSSFASTQSQDAQLSFFPPQDCLLGSARCVLLQCPLHSLSGQAVLKIHARLWNSSFIEVQKWHGPGIIPSAAPYCTSQLQLRSKWVMGNCSRRKLWWAVSFNFRIDISWLGIFLILKLKIGLKWLIISHI